MKRRARSGFVAHDDICFDLIPERLGRVFAASGRVDGRRADDFVVEYLQPCEVARLFPSQARAIADAIQTSWAYAA